MCLLVMLIGVDPDYPIVVAGNRDEARDRRASPPGLFVGDRMRMLSPRDRRAGGTWLGVNEVGLVAGLTNLAGVAPPPEGAPTRGDLPHLALDTANLDDASAAVEARLATAPHGGFQLAITDGATIRVLCWDGAELAREDVETGVVVISNEHRVGELELPDLPAALEPGLALDARFERLAELLRDDGSRSGHPVLKRGGDYGTVSSSLIAVRPGDPSALRWRYAPGQPDETAYRNYGNLSRRLMGSR